MFFIKEDTSNIHVEKKFNRSKDAVLEMGVEAVKYAKTLLPHVRRQNLFGPRHGYGYYESERHRFLERHQCRIAG